MNQPAGLRRLNGAGHSTAAGMAASVAALGGVELWLLARAGLPGAVPAAAGPAAVLVPFVAGPAALCAGWGMLALWRAGRRQAAFAGLLVAGASLLAGLFAAGAAAQAGRLVILLGIVVPLLVAHTADVAMLGWATHLGRLGRGALLAAAALPLAAALMAWPAPLWSVVALLPIVLLTPLLSAAFLTGARPDARPHGAPVLAAAFFALPFALLGGVGVAAGASALGSVLVRVFLPFFFFLGPPAPLLLAVVLFLVLALPSSHPAPARRAPASRRLEPAIPKPLPRPQRTPAALPVGEQRSQILNLLTDRFLAGELTPAEYQTQVDYVLRRERGRRPAAAAAGAAAGAPAQPARGPAAAALPEPPAPVPPAGRARSEVPRPVRVVPERPAQSAYVARVE